MRSKRMRKGGTLLLAAMGLASILGASAGGSMSYFTTYATARGGYTLDLGTRTELEEEWKDWEKRIQVHNTGTADCYIRAGIFAGSGVNLEYAGEGWQQGEDGYWYYDQVVPSGEYTGELVVSISHVQELDESFNVIVLEECAPVLYDGSGVPYPSTAAQVWAQSFQTEEGGA